MNLFRLLVSGLVLSGLSGHANAQFVDIIINGGSSWTLNTSSSDGPGQVLTCYQPPPGFPCQVSDGQCAEVEWDIRLTLGANSRASSYAKYTGSNHAGCTLNPVSANASKSGYVSFVHTSTGTMEYSVTSNAGANNTYAHANGNASADFTITLYGIYINPPQISPPWQVTRSNSASLTGTTPTVNDFADLIGSKSNKNNFTVSVSTNGSADISLPSALITNPGVLGSVSAVPNSNSYIRLKD